MANKFEEAQKKFLNYAGLQHYDELIKKLIAKNQGDAAKAVKELTERIYGNGEGAEHVDGTVDVINARIGDLEDLVGELPADADVDTVVAYIEELVAAEEDARKAHIGDLGKVSEEEGAADHTVKSYVDAKVEEINGEAEALENRVEALEATHATKEDGSFKTVAEEVNEAVVDLIDGAPEALDTLKEIADWIANQDESGVTDAATLVARVEENAQAIADEAERAEGAESDLQDAIDALDKKLHGDADAESAADKAGELKTLESDLKQYVDDEFDAFDFITNPEIDALFAGLGVLDEEEPGEDENA